MRVTPAGEDVERDPSGDAELSALRSSVQHLRDVAAGLSDDDLTRSAYPSEWCIADVLSHLGSGAVITLRRLDDTLEGRETPEDHAPGVWEQWNAKTAVLQRADALVADAALLARLETVPATQRASAVFSMGPMSLSFGEFVAMRLNEHVFHTWDIEVVDDPSAILLAEAVDLVVDNLELVARFTARPSGDTRLIAVTTTAPERHFAIDLTPETATFRRGPEPADTHPDLKLPAEAFARLIYGRLDPKHASPGEKGGMLDELRHVFPGP